jgi:hypothetical protein
MALFNLSVTTKEAGFMRNFPSVIDKALKSAGVGYVGERGNYPGQAAPYRADGRTVTAYKRTRSFASRPAQSYVITKSSSTMELYSMTYGKYILKGTWKWAGWPEKLEEIKKAIVEGFKKGISQAIKP